MVEHFCTVNFSFILTVHQEAKNLLSKMSPGVIFPVHAHSRSPSLYVCGEQCFYFAMCRLIHVTESYHE